MSRRLSKLEGLKLLKVLDFNVIEFIENRIPTNEEYSQFKKWSIRTSSEEGINVLLPSKHNVEQISELKDFFETYRGKFETIVHRTVMPEVIGTVIMYLDQNSNKVMVCETFSNFEERRLGKYKSQYIWEFFNKRILLKSENGEIKESFRELITVEIPQIFRKLNLDNLNLEFIIEDNHEVLYTDLSTFGHISL